MASWSELLPELLGLVIARLPFPADRARFRAVCRWWHSSVRQHVPPPQQLPWIVLPDGYFLTASDGERHQLPSFPENTSCVGSTDGWIALHHEDTHNLALHNPFTNSTVPLAELDQALIGTSSKVRKVLMRSTSTADDLIAIMTDSGSYPFILYQRGKGTWLPDPSEMPFIFFVDIAFHGGKLYAITKAEDLLSMDIGLDGDGNPTVFHGRRHIQQPIDYSDYDAWDSDHELEEVVENGEYVAVVVENEEEGEAANNEDETDVAAVTNEKAAATPRGYVDGVDHAYDELGEPTITVRYLVESRGKLLMVKRQIQTRGFCSNSTRKVEIFEADEDKRLWMPVSAGLGGGQALFISKCFSKSVSAPCGEIKEDAIYFGDTGEVFDMRAQTISLTRWCMPFQLPAWVFPPEPLMV